MTAQELAAKPAKEVRKNEELMELYMKEYTALFGTEPDCWGCHFSADFNKFTRAVKSGISQRKLTRNNTIMKKTFKIKRQYLTGKIFNYRRDGRMQRSYGHNMTEEFARELLTLGTKEELEARVEMFETLPEDEDGKTVNPTVKPPKPTEEDNKEEVKDEDLTLTELREKYPDVKARSKADFLKEIE